MALLPGLIPRSLWSFVSGARRRDPARPNHDQNRVGVARSLHLPALPSPSSHPNSSFGGAIANAGQNPQPVVLQEQGRIMEIADTNRRYRQIAADYLAGVEAKQHTLVVSPGNDERKALNAEI